MARSNTGSTSNRFTNATTPATAVPITLACWFKPANLTTAQNLVFLSNSGFNNYFGLQYDGANSNGQGDNVVLANSLESFAASSTGGTAGTWMHCGAVFTSTTSRQAFRDGVGGTVGTASSSPGSISVTHIGSLSTFSPLNGDMAEVGIWNVALTADEMLALSKGYSPLFIRPNNLLRYWHLRGNGTETCRISNQALTLVGTMAKAAHVPIIQPRLPMLGIQAPVADAWNTNDKSANITLSASDKTAAITSATAGGVRSTAMRMNGSAGKYYAEFLCVDKIGTNYRLGIIGSSISLTSVTGHFYVRAFDGLIHINGVSSGIAIGAFTDSDVVSVAWDSGAERVWFRLNGGNWNNNAANDPATGTGGVDASFATAITHGLWFYSSGASGETATLRTELAEFTQAVPSGFSSWMDEAGGPVAYTLPAVAGTYALTGIAATPTLARVLDAVSAGSYALTGQPATLVLAAPSSSTTWNSSDKTAGVTLTNGNYTAVLGTATGHVRSVATHAAAKKYYAEWQAGTWPGAQVGVASASVAFATQDPYLNGASFYGGDGSSNAGVYIASGTPVYEVPALVVDDVVGMAVDFDNDKVWFRVNGGNWNNSGTANPATNTGGLTYAASDLQALFASNYVVDGADPSLWTYFPFNFAVPVGFAAWQPIAEIAVTATGGSYALTGATAGVYRGREVLAVAGTYGLSGTAASIEFGREVAADPGSYALTGTAAQFRRTWAAAASGGSYTLTGTPANLLKPNAYAIIGLPGAYALSGSTASLVRGRKVVAVAGSRLLFGQVASLEWGREAVAAAGTYALTGTATTFRRTWQASAVGGSYVLTGLPVNLLTVGARAIVGLPGAYALAGPANSLEWGREAVATAGSYALTGIAANLERGLEVLASNGAYAVTGAAATFLSTRRVTAVSGSYSLSGLPANLLRFGAYAIIGLPGAYTLSGVAATLSKTTAAAYSVIAEAGSYHLAGSPVSLIWSGEGVPVTPPGGMPWWGHGGHVPKKQLRKAVKELLEREEKRKKRKKPKEIAKEIIAAIEPQGLGVAEKRIVTRLISQALASQLPQMFYSQPLIRDKGELERAILFIIEAAMQRILDEEEDEEAALLLLSAA